MSTHRLPSFAGGTFAAVFLALLALLFAIVPGRAATPAATTTTYAAGAYIVDMGQSPQTKANALKPYGFLYQVLAKRNLPVDWVIADGKVGGNAGNGKADGVDFSASVLPNRTGSATSKTYRSSAFVIRAETLADPAAKAALDAWLTANPSVVVDKLATETDLPLYRTLTYWPRAVLDAKNGSIAAAYFLNAGIPNEARAYTYKDPDELTDCDDVYVMPHADPTWASHSDLLAFNLGGGAIWTGCHAFSVLENLDDPSDPGTDPDMNFLTTNGAVPDGSHKDATPPYAYLEDGSDPGMQFLGITDDAHTNGSEQVYLPDKLKGSEWRESTTVVSFDRDQSDVVAGIKSDGPAAIIAYGRGFGLEDAGWVVTEAGHSLNKDGDAEDVAAQRVFFNLILLNAGVDRAAQIDAAIPETIPPGETLLEPTVLTGSAPFTYAWSDTCGGTFDAQTGETEDGAISTTYTAPEVSEETDCLIRLVITDSCGRETVVASPTTIVPEPELTLDKSADVTTYAAVDDVITYTFSVENTGNVALTGPVTIDDDLTDDETCPALTTIGDNDADLDPGEILECSATYTITQADLDAGSVENAATAEADGTTSNEDTETVSADQTPELTLDKSADVTTYAAVDDEIVYTFDLENTGNVTLTDVTIEDPLPGLGTLDCGDDTLPVASLAPGGTISCSATYTVTQEDLDAGSVENTATATGTDPNDEEVETTDDETVSADQTPELTLDKSADVTTYAAVDDEIVYTFDLENTGNVTLTDVTIEDPLPGLGTLDCGDDTLPVASLAPGGTISCSATYTVTQEDLDAGSVENTATATGTDPNDEEVETTDDETVSADQTPELTLDKSADVTTYDAAGDVISYTFSVENTGNITLAGPVTIDDDLTDDESCPALTTVGDNDSDLDPGETVECTATYTIDVADLGEPSVENVATAEADGTTSNEDSATVENDRIEGLRLVKASTIREFAQTVGFLIPFTFTVTNTGNVPLDGPVVVDDDLTDDESCPALATVGDQDGKLDPGETIVCTATYAVTADDIAAKRVVNSATAEVEGVTSNDDTVTVAMAPTIAVLLDATGSIQGAPARRTVRLYNAFLSKWQAKTQLAPYSLSLFNSYSYRELYTDRPIASVPRMTLKTLNPRGLTPLYDAAVRAIKAVDARNPIGQVIFVISTDGADNASKTQTKASLVRLIRRMEAKGWRFVYEGVKIAALERAVERARAADRADRGRPG